MVGAPVAHNVPQVHIAKQAPKSFPEDVELGFQDEKNQNRNYAIEVKPPIENIKLKLRNARLTRMRV